MKYRQKLLTASLLVALISVAVVLRGPLEIFAGNTKDFLFTLGDFFPIMVALTLLSVAVLGALLALLPDKLFLVASVPLLWLGVSIWVQDLFLNTKLAEANGGPMDWAALGSLPVKNAAVWLALLVGAILLSVLARKSWFFLARLVAGGLFLVQLVACVTVFLTMPVAEPHGDRHLSGVPQMQVAGEDNVIVLVFDSVSTGPVKDMLEQYPEAASILKDFTFYDNTCSNYFPTYPSVTHLLTGYELEFGTVAQDWMRTAWTSPRCEQFYQNLRDEGYTCRIYADNIQYVYGGVENLEGKFENTASIPLRADKVALTGKLLKFSTYRFAPYVCKPAVEVLTSDFDKVVTSVDTPLCTTDNVEFYQRLKDEPLSIDPNVKKLFVYEHLLGAHPPLRMDAQANHVEEDTTQIETIRGVFTIIDEYLTQLKALGVYDQASIIITADHGSFPSGLTPFLYLKRPGETHDQSPVNTAPIEFADFQATVMELVGRNDGSFGTSFFDWEPEQERKRVFWSSIHDDDEPSVGLYYNVHTGWIYYKNAQELEELYAKGEPDMVERANVWNALTSDL